MILLSAIDYQIPISSSFIQHLSFVKRFDRGHLITD